MSSCQASEQRPNRVVVQAYHATPDPGIGLCGRESQKRG
jgi:hypothetical protein